MSVPENTNIRERVRDQFCSKENVNYLLSVIHDKIKDASLKKYLTDNIDGYIRNFSRRFGASEAVYSSLTNVKTLRTDDDMKWDGVRRLNNMFLELVIDKYGEDFKSDAVARYGYLDSMFVATDLRPCGYESLNGSEIQSFNISSDDKRKCPKDILKQEPYNRYHGAFMNVKVNDMNRTEINGNDSIAPFYNEHVDGIEWYMKQRREDSVVKKEKTEKFTPLYVNQNRYPELLTPKVKRNYTDKVKCSDNPKEEEDEDIEPVIYDIDGAPSYPGGQSAFARDANKHMEPFDREGQGSRQHQHRWANAQEHPGEKIPTWQNLSKRNIQRIENGEVDDYFDASITEKNNYPAGGQHNARGNPQLQTGYGEGYRFKHTPLNAGNPYDKLLVRSENFMTLNVPEYKRPGTVPHRYRDDEQSHYNRELGFKQYKQDISSMFDYPRQINYTPSLPKQYK
jgi:hypothetical protein